MDRTEADTGHKLSLPIGRSIPGELLVLQNGWIRAGGRGSCESLRYLSMTIIASGSFCPPGETRLHLPFPKIVFFFNFFHKVICLFAVLFPSSGSCHCEQL